MDSTEVLTSRLDRMQQEFDEHKAWSDKVTNDNVASHNDTNSKVAVMERLLIMQGEDMKSVKTETAEQTKQLFMIKENSDKQVRLLEQQIARTASAEDVAMLKERVTILDTRFKLVLGILSAVGLSVLGIAIKLLFGMDK